MPDIIPYRQIHLDFHTSELIGGIGAQFDADEWVETLKLGRVNSINVFAKCHHGMFYYPTKVGTVHPGLGSLNLLGEMAKVLRREQIRFVIYTCVNWSEDTALKHPEWQQLNKAGVLGQRSPFEDHFCNWRNLCLQQPGYRALLKEELREQHELFKPDGWWIDIVFQYSCVCPNCQAMMKKMGIDPGDDAAVRRFHRIGVISFMKEIYEFIHSELSDESQVYFNGNPYELDNADIPELSSLEKRKYFDFIDIESLPSEYWGYTHFPVAVNYLNKYDKEVALMNGKFHIAWGDFGSLRNEAAMEFECLRAVAYGAKVCVGDQMHPGGKLSVAAYRLIGKSFGLIEEREPWLKGTRKVCDVAVALPTPTLSGEYQASVEGAYRVLADLKLPFDYVNFQDDLAGYKLLILPDFVSLTDAMATKVNGFVKGGGKLLVTGRSGVSDGKFVIENAPAKYVGPSEYKMRYLRFTENALFAEWPEFDHILYERGERAEAADGAEVLAKIVLPYFDRNHEQFCSHRQTPPRLETSCSDAITANGDCVYIASPLFADYALNGYSAHREIIAACIKKLYGRLPLESNLPHLSEVTLRQNDAGLLVHSLSYSITRRCKLLDTIDDALELHDRTYSVRSPFAPSAVKLVPEGKDLDFGCADGYVTYKVPYQKGHSLVHIMN
ncbi:MAG: beta-galactosidase trimerization domain-containing protein [Defluviitaleaceae bacterium]|nr:beta-galactosidase trimerization domain-containing protein [Defluviitaleaceae bacterium]